MRRILPALAALAIAGSAQAATIVNGSFEIGIPDPGQFATLPAGDTTINGWTIGGAGVDYIGTYWVAQDGTRSVDLSALAGGSLSQDVETVVGQAYRLDFWQSGNPEGAPSLKTLIASAGGVSGEYTIDSALFTTPDLQWTKYSLFFTALATTTTVTFASSVETPYGPALDSVAITAVPEASTWAMMIAGIGLVGFASRRRRPTVAA